MDAPDPAADPALAGLLEDMRQRHRGAVCGILLYGSCLRSGDLADGILDLYLILDSYRAAYPHWPLAAANWLLPPNVIYAEHSAAGRTLRAKVALISRRDFQRGCTPARLESYIWGRFAQPTAILYSRDAATRELLQASLLEASRSLLRAALPALPERGRVTTLWEGALALSYATELRSERTGRSAELVRDSCDFYVTVTRRHAAALGLTLYEEGGELHYARVVGSARHRLGRLAWAARRVQGKALSVARLVKALFTFEGGLDYLAWKLSRHSGEEIVIPERVRRAPLIYIWGFCLQLYRRGIFR